MHCVNNRSQNFNPVLLNLIASDIELFRTDYFKSKSPDNSSLVYEFFNKVYFSPIHQSSTHHGTKNSSALGKGGLQTILITGERGVFNQFWSRGGGREGERRGVEWGGGRGMEGGPLYRRESSSLCEQKDRNCENITFPIFRCTHYKYQLDFYPELKLN